MEIFVQSASKQYSYIFDTHTYGHIYCVCVGVHMLCVRAFPNITLSGG